jgi:hypothetical protein
MNTSRFVASKAFYLLAVPAVAALWIAELASCGGDDATSALVPDASEASVADGTTLGDGPSTEPTDGGGIDANASSDAATDLDSSAVAVDAEGGSQTDGGDGGTCSVAVPAASDYLAALSNLVCGNLKSCCGTSAQFDMANCLTVYRNTSFGGWLGVGRAIPFLDGGRISYDTSASCQCLAETAVVGCGLITEQTFGDIQHTCFAAVSGTSGVSDGGDAAAGRCASSYECAGGEYCTVNTASDPADAASLGSCVRLSGDGGSCASDDQCSYLGNGPPNLYCSTTSHTCVPRLADGVTCNLSSNCISNICAFSVDAGSAICAGGYLFSTPLGSNGPCDYFLLPDAGLDAGSAADAADGG